MSNNLEKKYKVSRETLKYIRNETGAGMADIKVAYEKCDGNISKTIDYILKHPHINNSVNVKFYPDEDNKEE